MKTRYENEKSANEKLNAESTKKSEEILAFKRQVTEEDAAIKSLQTDIEKFKVLKKMKNTRPQWLTPRNWGKNAKRKITC